MSRAVLDSSAALAVINIERGGDVAASALGLGMISAVNAAEVLTKLMEQGAALSAALRELDRLALQTRPFDEELVADTAALRALTRHRGLSLGDRACLALARREDLPVLTADRAWEGLDVGVEVVLIR